MPLSDFEISHAEAQANGVFFLRSDPAVTFLPLILGQL
jgi:hypothetical protein